MEAAELSPTIVPLINVPIGILLGLDPDCCGAITPASLPVSMTSAGSVEPAQLDERSLSVRCVRFNFLSMSSCTRIRPSSKIGERSVYLKKSVIFDRFCLFSRMALKSVNFGQNLSRPPLSSDKSESGVRHFIRILIE